MKRLLLATTACVGMAVAAQAADLPARAAPPPVYVPPAFTWTGFYIGVNAGYGFETRRHNNGFFGNDNLFFPANNAAFNPGSGYTSTNPLFPNATPFYVIGANGAPFTAPGTFLTFNNAGLGSRRRNDGFVGGGQIGYNWQLTPGAGIVIGIEADAQFADLNRRNNDFLGFNNGITFGPGVAGAPLFTNPVVVPASVGITAPLLIPAAANPVGTGPLFNNLALGVFLNNPGFVPTAAQLLSTQAVSPVTFFNPFANNIAGNRGVDWFGTVRGRLGYAFDRALLYVTGGFAYGGGDRNNDGFNNGIGSFGFGGNCGGFNNLNCDGSRIKVGYTVGGGLEYAFTNNLSVKLEGLFVSLDDRRNRNAFFGATTIPYARDAAGVVYSAPAAAFSNNGFGFLDRRNRDEFAVVRVGLNYKLDFFGPPAAPAPVVARY